MYPTHLSDNLESSVLSWSKGEDPGMAQVVVKNLELDCVPEPTPGTRKDTVHKLVPELGKRGFDGLPPLCRQELLFGCIGSCQHQHLGFFGPLLSPLLASVAQIAQGNAAI